MTNADPVEVSGAAVVVFTLIFVGWLGAIAALVDAIRRRVKGNETAGTWVVFLATSLIAVPLAGLVALGYVVFVVGRNREVVEGPELPGVGMVASLSSRIWASTLDGALVGVPLVILTWNLSTIDLSARVFQTPGWVPWFAWAISTLYQVVAVAVWGQTLGKRITGIEVVNADNGTRPTLRAAALRTAPLLASRVPYLGSLAIVAYLPLLWRDDRRGLHDLLAGTVVIRRNRAVTRSRGHDVRGLVSKGRTGNGQCVVVPPESRRPQRRSTRHWPSRVKRCCLLVPFSRRHEGASVQHALIIEFPAAGVDAKALYQSVTDELGLGDSGLAPGAISHTAAMSETSLLTIFELWESREAQEEFMRLQLMPALQKKGAPTPTRVEWLDVYAHNHV